MNRRSFLQRATHAALLVSASAALPAFVAGAARSAALPDTLVRGNGRLLKGTPRGSILESSDGGRIWQTVANFGTHCSVLAVWEVGGQVYARVGLQGHSFAVKSPDARTWYTLDWQPAGA